MNELIDTTSTGFTNTFGSYTLAGLALVIIILFAMVKHGFHLSTAVVISVPLILALVASGDLPQAVGFAVLFGLAALVFYSIYPLITGGDRL